MRLKSTFALAANRREGLFKPNEDYLVCDDRLGLYLIADGVTRPHDEYGPEIRSSLAAEAAMHFCETVRALLESQYKSSEWPDTGTATDRCLEQLLLQANERLSDSFREHPVYPPAATCIAVFAMGDRFYHCSNCDCAGFLLRDGQKRLFADRVPGMDRVAKAMRKADFQLAYYNNRDNPDGFGMIDGDPRLADFLRVRSMQPLPGDQLILSSDGMYSFLEAASAETLSGKTAQELIDISGNYDIPPWNSYADDKACIVLTVFPE